MKRYSFVQSAVFAIVSFLILLCLDWLLPDAISIWVLGFFAVIGIFVSVASAMLTTMGRGSPLSWGLTLVAIVVLAVNNELFFPWGPILLGLGYLVVMTPLIYQQP